MIKTVTVINYLGERLDLELAAPEKSGLFVQSITGIGPGKASINVTNMASNDGGIVNSTRAETRNIVMKIGMYEHFVEDSSWTIEKARLKTYKYFPKKRELTLAFKTDGRYVYTKGYVESNEPDIFSSKFEACQISIICPDPNFYEASGETYIRLARIVDLLEFPYSNESLTENLTEFGSIFTDLSQVILTYTGEIETGINIKVRCSGPVTGFKLYNFETGEKIEISDSKLTQVVPDGLSDGDEIRICTIRGKKSAKLIREGNSYNILNSLGLHPSWFQIYQGDNIFSYDATSGSSNVKIEMTYENAYEGV